MCDDELAAGVPARDKTKSRRIAEQSLIAATCFAITVSFCIYKVGETPLGLQFPNKTTKGATELINLVQKANPGVSLYRVRPWAQINCDDQTFVTYIDLDGSSSDKGPRITHIESYQEKNVHSIFKGSGDSQSSPKNVQRVKNSWIFNAAGQMAEPMFTLTGLSESELPRDTCCFAEGPMETAWKKLVIDTCATKASTAS